MIRLGKRPLSNIGSVEPVDALIWDVAGEKLIRTAIDESLRVVSLDVMATRFYSLASLPRALWYVIAALLIRKDDGAKFLRIQSASVTGALRIVGQCLNVSAILAHRPKVVLSYIDDSITTQRIDAILCRHLHVITLQNGRRWHSACLTKFPEYRISYIPPGFHSCFAALSRQEIEHHRDAGWSISEAHDIGGLNAALAYSPCSIDKPKYDICIVENSPAGVDRESNRRMASLINSYARSKALRVCVALKRNEDDVGYEDYYRAVRQMYAETIELVPRSKLGSSISLTMSSRLTIGIISTLLIETFGLGNRIYPLNFEHEAFDVGYSCLGLKMRPDQQQFDATVDDLLSISDEEYLVRYKDRMDYIGAISRDKRPIERLKTLLAHKLATTPNT